MGAIEQAIDLIKGMNRSDKTRLLTVLASDPDLQTSGNEAIDQKILNMRKQREQRVGTLGWIGLQFRRHFCVRLMANPLLLEVLVSPFALLPPVETESHALG